MKKYTIISKPLFVMALAVGLTLSACKESSQIDKVSDEDVEALTLIVSQTLSDQNEGFMTDVYDVQRNLNVGTASKAQTGPQNRPAERDWRGGESGHERTYNPEDGTHTFSYTRSFTREQFSKSMSATQTYIFYSPDGEFVEFPRQEEVASIRFDGSRNLTMSTRMTSSVSDRSANWFLSGLTTTTHTLTGTQSNIGQMTVENPRRGTMSRVYSMVYTFADVTIEKDIREEGTLEDNISGTISYEINLKRTVNGEEVVREMSGTIDLAGNGKAILRVKGLSNVYQINLADGTVSE